MTIWDIDAWQRRKYLSSAVSCYFMSISDKVSYLVDNIMLLSQIITTMISTAKFERNNLSFTGIYMQNVYPFSHNFTDLTYTGIHIIWHTYIHRQTHFSVIDWIALADLRQEGYKLSFFLGSNSITVTQIRHSVSKIEIPFDRLISAGKHSIFCVKTPERFETK